MASFDVDLMKFSISCFNVPDELMVKTTAKTYFQQFGKLSRVRLRPKQKACIVEYLDEESAVRALTEGGEFAGCNFGVSWTKQKSEKKKSRKKPEWSTDSDIQAELEAMRGSYASSRPYVSRSEDSLESPKRSSIKKPQSRHRKPEKHDRSEKPKPKPEPVSSMTNEQDAELLKIIMNSASTTEEKYRILDARDKLIRSRTVRQSELSRAVKTVGTCPDMCPEKERIMREVQHQVSSYEQLSAHKGSMNHNLAVKQYSRSSADQESPLPHELRPVGVLLLTMGYLLHKILDLCDASDVNLAEWYHFLWDRTRGIRKDVTQQELCCLDSVKLVEQCARFHVFCAARLVNEDVSVFDDKINTENLTKCLQTLKYMYHDLRVKNGVQCPNEAEFRAYVVLLNLNDGNFMWEVQQLDEKIQLSPEIKFAIDVYFAIDQNNYVRFFKLVKSTTFLNACILLRYFNQVRYRALLTILKCYSPRQPYMHYPLAELCRILAFEDLQSTVEFLEYYGLSLNQEKTHVILDRKMFHQPDMPFVLERAINIIETKRQCSVGEIVCGAPLPSKDFERHMPHNSFENGFLKLSELPKDFQAKYQEFLERNSVSQEVEDLEEENVDAGMNLEEIEEQEMSETDPEPVAAFQEIDKNSRSEPDGTAIIFSAFKPKENKTPEATFNFWPAQKQNTSNFTSIFNQATPKSIFENREVLKPQLPVNPISTAPSFTFTNNKIFTPIATIKKPEPVKINPIVVPCTENKEEKRKEEMKELLRKHKEQQEKEERLRKERRQVEERKIQEKLRLEQARRKQEAIQAEKIHSEVSSVLQNVLNMVEEQLVKNRLSEISENIKKRRALHFVRRWRNLTKISRKKRKNFFDNPVWISSKSTSSEAEDLYTHSQSLTLHDIKRYKRGTPEAITINKELTYNIIDVYKIVYRTLFENLCSGDHLLNLNLFWKIGLCFRSLGERNLKLNRFYDKLKCIFEWQEINNESYVVKRCYANNGGSLTHCVKEISKIDGSSFLNGLIFFNLSDINSNSYNRLVKLFKNITPIPVVIISKDASPGIDKNHVIQNLKLNSLVEKGLITSFEVLFCSDINLELILSCALKFLAKNVNTKPSLEMDALPVFLRNCVGDEFWYRIHSSCQINERLEILLREPNIAIDLHNESLKKSLDLIFDRNLLKQPVFPNEFKPYVKQQQILLPCSYEYFPDYWNSKNYLNKVKNCIELLFLPKFDFTWPPKDQCDLQDILEEYCGNIFKDPTCIVLKLLSLFLDKIDLNSNFEDQMKLVSWASVVQIIALEKISNSQFYDKTHAVYTVVYKSDSLREFREVPWWYSTETIKSKLKYVQIEEFNQPEVIIEESEVELDLDKTFADLREEEDDNFEEKSKVKNDFQNLTNLLADLEESMEIQKKIMNRFQEKVTNTFHCK